MVYGYGIVVVVVVVMVMVMGTLMVSTQDGATQRPATRSATSESMLVEASSTPRGVYRLRNEEAS
jgi:hypothetical protein